MAGIDSLVNNRADAFAGNPQGLMQRYSMSQDLLDLLALQKLKQDKEAAQRELMMQMQTPPQTVRDQLNNELTAATRHEVAQALSPGIQQQGQRMAAQQLQQAMSAGLPTQPAPNMAGMAQGGIVGYQDGGEVRRRSGYDIRQAEKEAMRERAGPEMQEFMQGLEESIGEGRDWAAENPIDAASLALLTASGAGYVPAVGRAALATLPMLKTAGPKALQAARSLYSKANPAYYSRVTKSGNRVYPAGVPERLFSPGRTAGTAAGLQGLSYLFGNGEEEQEGILDEGIATDQSVEQPPELPPLPEIDENAAYERSLSSVRPSPAAFTETATPTTAQAQGIATLVESPEAPQARKDRSAQYDDIISRSKARLEQLEAQEKDKLGTLIAFLQGAGASGGTNFGATMTGGGAGVAARNQNIQNEMRDTIRNIEQLQMKQVELDMAGEEKDIDRQQRFAEFSTNLARFNRDFEENVRQFGLEYALENKKADINAAMKEIQMGLQELKLQQMRGGTDAAEAQALLKNISEFLGAAGTYLSPGDVQKLTDEYQRVLAMTTPVTMGPELQDIMRRFSTPAQD
jgi:hypothetical protein